MNIIFIIAIIFLIILIVILSIFSILLMRGISNKKFSDEEQLEFLEKWRLTHEK